MTNFPTLVSSERMVIMLACEYEIIPQERCQEEGVVFCSVKSDGEEFNLFAKRIPLNEPDSPEEKKCCEKCERMNSEYTKYCSFPGYCPCHQPEVSQEKEMFKGFDYFVPPYSEDNLYRKGEEAGRLAERKEIEKYLESQIKLMTDYPILSDARVLELRHALAAIRERK